MECDPRPRATAETQGLRKGQRQCIHVSVLVVITVIAAIKKGVFIKQHTVKSLAVKRHHFSNSQAEQKRMDVREGKANVVKMLLFEESR